MEHIVSVDHVPEIFMKCEYISNVQIVYISILYTIIITILHFCLLVFIQIHLAECCPRLNTLIIRELISTATLLIIVTTARNLTRLFVRRNALRKRFDCIRNEQWSDTFYEWLRQTSRSYEHTFQAVSDKLGYQWMPLTDDQFKRVQPDVRF